MQPIGATITNKHYFAITPLSCFAHNLFIKDNSFAKCLFLQCVVLSGPIASNANYAHWYLQTFYQKRFMISRKIDS